MSDKPATFDLDSLSALAAEVIALRNLGVAVASVLGVDLKYYGLTDVISRLKSELVSRAASAERSQAEVSEIYRAAGCESKAELIGWIRESRQLRKLIKSGSLPADADADTSDE